MTLATPRHRKHANNLRFAFLTAGSLLLASASMAQSRTDEATPERTGTELPVLEQDGTAAPTLNREVKQDLSKVPASPDDPARKREEPKEDKGPVPLQPFVEPEPSAEPVPE